MKRILPNLFFLETIRPLSKAEYVGQSKSSERFELRKKEHNRKFGVKHEYDTLEDKVKGKEYLDYLEEKHIRDKGGLKKDRGKLVNKRHQITNQRYEELKKKYNEI